MPTYEYHCEACNQVVEIFHSMTAKPAEICPKCGKKALHRRISGGSGIIFKGSGFYCTDYKHSSATPASVEPTSGSSDSAPSSETKPEPKTDAKAPAKTEKAKSESNSKAGK
ncbi:MAG: zinc ribbon domain-containing protein [Thermoguttaceae bacterium]|nr:zinc ribbon domain-containing protein [Thermoguttaceae bacterium]